MPLDYRPRKEWLLREFAPFRSQILSTTPSTLRRFEGVLAPQSRQMVTYKRCRKAIRRFSGSATGISVHLVRLRFHSVTYKVIVIFRESFEGFHRHRLGGQSRSHQLSSTLGFFHLRFQFFH